MSTFMAMRFRLFVSATTLTLAMVFLVLPAVVAARAEVRIQEVTSPKGITAWLVEDYSVPIIAIRFRFDGGSSQDPAGKEGLANLMTGLFDEGAGDLDSNTFQTKLDEAGAEMSFNESNDAVGGAMRMLADTAPTHRRLEFGRARIVQKQERRQMLVVGTIVGKQRAHGKTIADPMTGWSAMDTKDLLHCRLRNA